ncbi:Autophagy- protein 9B [Saguinus oedipus]|uniref:Autophagy- protein 9B n=1 Tax=Saguinus oedipus TaxID=9490 RepID=A0ABQ9UIK3_SAGOE|nr:Autophagy- protein 9B [Saguinus oedipus]
MLYFSCVSPGGTGGQKLAQLPELASAEMSLHAIYLHQLRHQQQQELWGEAVASDLSRPCSSPSQPPSPDEEKPSWSSDGEEGGACRRQSLVDTGHPGTAQLMAFVTRLQSCL